MERSRLSHVHAASRHLEHQSRRTLLRSSFHRWKSFLWLRRRKTRAGLATSTTCDVVADQTIRKLESLVDKLSEELWRRDRLLCSVAAQRDALVSATSEDLFSIESLLAATAQQRTPGEHRPIDRPAAAIANALVGMQLRIVALESALQRSLATVTKAQQKPGASTGFPKSVGGEGKSSPSTRGAPAPSQKVKTTTPGSFSSLRFVSATPPIHRTDRAGEEAEEQDGEEAEVLHDDGIQEMQPELNQQQECLGCSPAPPRQIGTVPRTPSPPPQPSARTVLRPSPNVSAAPPTMKILRAALNMCGSRTVSTCYYRASRDDDDEEALPDDSETPGDEDATPSREDNLRHVAKILPQRQLRPRLRQFNFVGLRSLEEAEKAGGTSLPTMTSNNGPCPSAPTTVINASRRKIDRTKQRSSSAHQTMQSSSGRKAPALPSSSSHDALVQSPPTTWTSAAVSAPSIKFTSSVVNSTARASSDSSALRSNRGGLGSSSIPAPLGIGSAKSATCVTSSGGTSIHDQSGLMRRLVNDDPSDNLNDEEEAFLIVDRNGTSSSDPEGGGSTAAVLQPASQAQQRFPFPIIVTTAQQQHNDHPQAEARDALRDGSSLLHQQCNDNSIHQ